ncbi:MAG TPA: hypothetical protein VJW93_12935 [Candidatus Acidoferrales bacterium]|nr:hypothetical protein [Candidatus Acidoferrales bacterium]
MKRILELLARLYPPNWRRRYGAEFDALLEDAAPSARDILDLLWGAFKMQITTWSFGRITVAGSLAGVLVATAISFAVPLHYLSQSFVEVTPANGSAPQSPRRLMDNVAQDVFSRDSLGSIIQEHNLYPRERARMPLDDVIDIMRRNIRVYSLTLASPENRDAFKFTVQFDYPDPHVAQEVNTALTSRVLEANLRMRQQQLDSGSTPISQLNPGFQFAVLDPPTLPRKPSAPNRTQFAAVGLFAGLLAGLTLAIALGSRRTTPV